MRIVMSAAVATVGLMSTWTSLAATPPATRPAATLPAAQVKYEIIIDHSEMPEIKEWVETKLRPKLEEWYPKIVELLPSEGYTAPRRLTVTFKKDANGVAWASGTSITCAGPWFLKNLEGEGVGAVVHELVHVVQQYRGRRNPGWLVEGVADYVRWHLYEPGKDRSRINPQRAKYTDSYRTTARFLAYVVKNHDPEIVKKLNAAMRQGRYTPEIWKEATGKTVDELWELFIKTL